MVAVIEPVTITDTKDAETGRGTRPGQASVSGWRNLLSPGARPAALRERELGAAGPTTGRDEPNLDLREDMPAALHDEELEETGSKSGSESRYSEPLPPAGAAQEGTDSVSAVEDGRRSERADGESHRRGSGERIRPLLTTLLSTSSLGALAVGLSLALSGCYRGGRGWDWQDSLSLEDRRLRNRLLFPDRCGRCRAGVPIVTTPATLCRVSQDCGEWNNRSAFPFTKTLVCVEDGLVAELWSRACPGAPRVTRDGFLSCVSQNASEQPSRET